jgi:hypothetical protein
MPSSPPLEPVGQCAFPHHLEAELNRYLKGIANRGIFSLAKKASYKKWLENPNGPIESDTPEAHAADANDRNRAKAWYRLVDGCIYCKSKRKKRYVY